VAQNASCAARAPATVCAYAFIHAHASGCLVIAATSFCKQSACKSTLQARPSRRRADVSARPHPCSRAAPQKQLLLHAPVLVVSESEMMVASDALHPLLKSVLNGRQDHRLGLCSCLPVLLWRLSSAPVSAHARPARNRHGASSSHRACIYHNLLPLQLKRGLFRRIAEGGRPD
jgi:hypothetical protein